MDLSDNYTVLYSFLGRSLIDAFGVAGEKALREGTRRYGRDRGENSRRNHEALNVKINMKSLFSVGGDLPPDPRFRRELQELNPEERVSHTLVCPMADIWKAYGEAHIGRIYCEEFHPACYSHYAFGYGHVNLGMTLTQEKDEYCDFNVVLRAENLPKDLRPKCFAEYDPGYIAPDVHPTPASGKTGFESISVKLYYYILEAALELLGESGWDAMAGAMKEMAVDGARRARKTAARYARPFNEQIVFDTYPLTLDQDKTQLWTGYTANKAVERFEETFVTAMRGELEKA
ncbi:L-2-amino-thiazoline-4-carboxylic acid hydrolase [Oscillibacter sp. GMB15532]|uniref:L-2-amino-thiazoline-4-carboxylic acid hydrolase n=1 Tax=Oscillibacter sp. GMB15532 TaxID=3230022 RepID=UPI0034DFE1AE